jgi:hypothetical protein
MVEPQKELRRLLLSNLQQQTFQPGRVGSVPLPEQETVGLQGLPGSPFSQDGGLGPLLASAASSPISFASG